MNKIAIGGVGGSGTRVFAELLLKCGLFVGGETNRASDNLWFTFLLRRPDWHITFPGDSEIIEALEVFSRCMQRSQNSTLHDKDRIYIEKGLQIWIDSGDSNRDWSSIAESMINGNSLREVNQQWAWKEPNTQIFLPWLKEVIPDVKYIHVIRNGFDMAFSKNQKQLKAWGSYLGLNHTDDVPLPVRSLEYWIASNNRAIEIGKSKFGSDFLVVSYDELVRNPAESLKLLMRFSGIAEDQSIVDSLVADIAPKSVGRHKDYPSTTFSQHHIDSVIKLGFFPEFKDLDDKTN